MGPRWRIRGCRGVQDDDGRPGREALIIDTEGDMGVTWRDELTGNLRFRLFNRHFTSRLVVQTIRVHNRSNAESTREAINERDEE
jgi:hypothetical protein